MNREKSSALISCDTLAAKLGAPHLRILDASWHMPAEGRNARAEFEKSHIPGAAFFDIDEISDTASPYPHMLPGAEAFPAAVRPLRIGTDDEIVVYDTKGLFSAARVWWMFRAFGHDKIKVLDGGLPKWTAENRKLENSPPLNEKKNTPFQARLRPELIRTMQQVEANITSKKELVLDARAPGRFEGVEPEPRAGLRSGHIEGSVNVFFKDCLSPPYNTLKTPEELHKLFAGKAIDTHQPLSATCGSGVTACILALALFEQGNEEVAVYDGAWAEWGSRQPR